jgi:hypothetical protein
MSSPLKAYFQSDTHTIPQIPNKILLMERVLGALNNFESFAESTSLTPDLRILMSSLISLCRFVGQCAGCVMVAIHFLMLSKPCRLLQPRLAPARYRDVCRHRSCLHAFRFCYCNPLPYTLSKKPIIIPFFDKTGSSIRRCRYPTITNLFGDLFCRGCFSYRDKI